MKKKVLAFGGSVIVGIIIGVGFVLWFYDLNEKSIMLARTAVSAFIVISLVIAAMQFRLNRKQAEITNAWNRKDAAHKAMHTSIEKLHNYIDEINPYFNLRQMMRNGMVASIVDIHNAMGVFVYAGENKDGKKLYKFVYHGQHTQDDIKSIHNKQEEGYCTDFRDGMEGREIEGLILAMLREYEYISMGCLQGIFDKKVIIEFMGPNITTTFNTFSDYIMHLRLDDRHGGGRSYVYENFELFSKEIVKYEYNKFNLNIVELEEDRKKHKVPFRLSHL